MDLLERRYLDSISGLPWGVVHGDAWQGNVVVADDGDPIVLDFEAFCMGPQYWDLIAVSVDYTDFDRISKREYDAFAMSYGFDVTGLAIYRTLAEIQELRWTSYVLGKAKPGTAEEKEAALRISCLKGEISRPWKWKAF
jgi:thiamine kinase-like enzyme